MSISISKSIAAIIHKHCGDENFQLLQGSLEYPEEIFATSIDDLIDSEFIKESDVPDELKGKLVGYMVLPIGKDTYRDEGATVNDLFIVDIKIEDGYVIGDLVDNYDIEVLDENEFTQSNDGTLARDIGFLHNDVQHVKETILVTDTEDLNGKDTPIAYELLHTIDESANYSPLYTGYKSAMFYVNPAKVKVYSEGNSLDIA